MIHVQSHHPASARTLSPGRLMPVGAIWRVRVARWVKILDLFHTVIYRHCSATLGPVAPWRVLLSSAHFVDSKVKIRQQLFRHDLQRPTPSEAAKKPNRCFQSDVEPFPAQPLARANSSSLPPIRSRIFLLFYPPPWPH